MKVRTTTGRTGAETPRAANVRNPDSDIVQHLLPIPLIEHPGFVFV